MYKNQNKNLLKIIEGLSKEIWKVLFGNFSNPKEFTIGGINSYDFHDDTLDRRVEVKSSSLSLTSSRGITMTFRRVKIGYFDDLILVAYFPDRIEMYIWDGKSYLRSHGTEGLSIQLAVHTVDGKFFFSKPFGVKFFIGYFDN